MRIVSSAAILLSCSTAFADEAPKIRVGVVPGLAVNVDPARADALAQDLSESLAAELDVDAIGGLAVRRVLPDQLPADCVTTPACIADIAARLHVNQLLFIVIVDSGTLQVDSTWVDVATGKSASRPPVDVEAGSDAKAKFALSARQLLPEAKVRIKTTTIVHHGQVGAMTPEIPRHFTPMAKLTTAITLVGLGAGIGFGLDARSHYNNCETSLTCATGARDGIRHLALAADMGYLVAVAAAVATGILYGTSGSESHLIVGPAEHGAMVGAFGRF
jgi:hypothetical protein